MMIWDSPEVSHCHGTYRWVMKQVSGRAGLPPGHGTPVATPPTGPGSGACFMLSTSSSNSMLGAGRRPSRLQSKESILRKPGNQVHVHLQKKKKCQHLVYKASWSEKYPSIKGVDWQDFWCLIRTHLQCPRIVPPCFVLNPQPSISSQAYRAEAGFCWPTTWGERLKGFGRRW